MYWWRKALSGASSLLIVVAYITCIIIAKTQDVYTGGLDMPYFSDIGRDKPGYFVFASLISSASVLMICFMPLQLKYFQAWLELANEKFRHTNNMAIAATVFGMIAPIGSILLSCFDTSSYPSLHNYSAYAFFVLIIVWAVLTLLVFRTLSKRFTEHGRLMVPRYVVMVTLGIAFLLYIPVGLAMVEWGNLSVAECEALELGDAYCESHRLAGTNDTDLFDYTETEGINLMRTSTQFICVVSIMVFLFLNVFDPSPLVAREQTGEDSASFQKTQA